MDDLSEFMQKMLYEEPKGYLSEAAYREYLQELKEYREWFYSRYPERKPPA